MSTDASETTDAALEPVPTDVPAGAPVTTCPYCERPFPTERLASLHLGERHPDLLTSAEAAAFEQSDDDERDDLFVYHLKVVALLVVVVMGLSYVYAFALA